MPSVRYVVALDRNMKATAPADWRETIAAIPGVIIVGDPTLPTLTIVASDDALAHIKQSLGSYVYIDPAIDHYSSG